MKILSGQMDKMDSPGKPNSLLIFGVLLLLLYPARLSAQHLRIFACAISNDSAGAFLGGSSRGSGLYQSDDTGKNWKHLGWENIKCYSMDMVQSSNGRILYMATGLGVLRSTDYGEHWKQITDWRVSEVMDVAVNQRNPDEIWIATTRGPSMTVDKGKHWNLKLKGLFEPFCSPIAYSFPSYDTLFLGARGTSYVRTRTDSAWRGAWEAPRIVDNVTGHSRGFARSNWGLTIGDDENHTVALRSSLGSGVMRSEGVRPPENSLPNRSIWTLKSFLVTP